MKTKTSSERMQIMFEYAPISLWEEDFSRIKIAFDNLRAQGVESLAPYLDMHPEFLDECMSRIIVRRVNQKTLELFKAKTEAELLANLGDVFRDEMRAHFRDELMALWEGKTYKLRPRWHPHCYTPALVNTTPRAADLGCRTGHPGGHNTTERSRTPFSGAV